MHSVKISARYLIVAEKFKKSIQNDGCTNLIGQQFATLSLTLSTASILDIVGHVYHP